MNDRRRNPQTPPTALDRARVIQTIAVALGMAAGVGMIAVTVAAKVLA